MDDYESLSPTECKYHVVFIPKCRRKTQYAELRRHLGNVFRKLTLPVITGVVRWLPTMMRTTASASDAT